MKIRTLNFTEKDGKLEIESVETEEITPEEMSTRMAKSFALLSIDRILCRKRKNYDPAILSKKIGIGD